VQCAPSFFLLETRAKDNAKTRLLDGQAQSNAENSEQAFRGSV